MADVHEFPSGERRPEGATSIRHAAVCQRCEFVQFDRKYHADAPQFWQCGARAQYCSHVNRDGLCDWYVEKKPKKTLWQRLRGVL